ncbi:MAG: flagellar hook-length control protein FliK [Pirellulaceae bacterium]
MDVSFLDSRVARDTAERPHTASSLCQDARPQESFVDHLQAEAPTVTRHAPPDASLQDADLPPEKLAPPQDPESEPGDETVAPKLAAATTTPLIAREEPHPVAPEAWEPIARETPQSATAEQRQSAAAQQKQPAAAEQKQPKLSERTRAAQRTQATEQTPAAQPTPVAQQTPAAQQTHAAQQTPATSADPLGSASNEPTQLEIAEPLPSPAAVDLPAHAASASIGIAAESSPAASSVAQARARQEAAGATRPARGTKTSQTDQPASPVPAGASTTKTPAPSAPIPEDATALVAVPESGSVAEVSTGPASALTAGWAHRTPASAPGAKAGTKAGEKSPVKSAPQGQASSESIAKPDSLLRAPAELKPTTPLVELATGDRLSGTDRADGSAAPTREDAAARTDAPSRLQSLAERLPDHLFGRGVLAEPASLEITQPDQLRFLQRVARAIEAAPQRGGFLRLRLRPPELGAMQLEVSLERGKLTARIETETQQARHVLLENLPQLRERLAEQGIHVEQFDVDVSSRDFGQTPFESHDPSHVLPRGSARRRAHGHSELSTELPHSADPSMHASPGKLNVVI